MNLEARLSRLEAALLPADTMAIGVSFGPSDEVPPPPTDRAALRSYLESVAMDATIPAGPPD